MKNVTIKDAKRNTIATFEDFPNRESEQKELLRRRFGEGKYYICHGVKSVDDTGAERTRGTQKVMYIGNLGGAAPGAALNPYPTAYAGAAQPGMIDLRLYHELMAPLMARIDGIENTLAELLESFDSDAMETATEPQPTRGTNDDEKRIAEALQKFQSGAPIGELLTEYADLIPKIMSQMQSAPAAE